MDVQITVSYVVPTSPLL